METACGNLLEIRDVSKDYVITKGFRKSQILKALSAISLSVPEKTTMGCVGESGCGKSTLAKIITLLERPSSGSVKFRGKEINTFTGKERKRYRREVQLVLQDPYSSLPDQMNVGTILTEPLLIHRIGDRSQREKRVKELLSYVKLSEKTINRYPTELSGGQRQRVSIARSLALNPSLIVCDEPVSALDVSIQAQILNLLKELQAGLHVNYFFISHDLRVVRYICDRLVVMYLGRIVENGETEEIFNRPLHPYTQALFHSIPILGMRQKHLAGLEGEVPSPIDAPNGCVFHPRCARKEPICTCETPPLREVGAGRWVACHLAV